MTSRESETTSTIAFKEWEIVCEALTRGEQHLIFRKGGIHEGRAGFSFKHDHFALFPTRFHEQGKHVTVPCPEPKGEWQIDEEVTVSHLAIAQWACTLTDWASVEALAKHHIYSRETLYDRFHWEGKGMPTGSIHVAFVRTFTLPSPLHFPYAKKYAGCRSWIEIPAFSRRDLRPVIGEEAFQKVAAELAGLVKEA